MIWWRRLARRWAWAVTGAATALIALRTPSVWADVRAAIAHGLRLPWLGAAAAAEAVCVAGLVMAQRQLLAAAGARLPVRAVAAAVFASTGLARLLPAGPAAAAAWQAGQYRRRDAASSTAGVWAVLAGGVASTVAALAVLAAGATAAARWWLLLGGAATLAAITAAAMAAAGPAPRPGGWPAMLAGHGGAGDWRRRLAGLARHRLGPRRGAAALAASGLSVLGEAGLLAAAFEVAGTPVGWCGGRWPARPASRRAAGAAARRARRDGRRRARRAGAHRHPPRHRADRGHPLPHRVAGELGTRRRRCCHGRSPHPPPPGPGRPAGDPLWRPQSPPAAGLGQQPGIKSARAHPGPAQPAEPRRQRKATRPAPGHRPVQGRPVPPPGTAAVPGPFPARHEHRGATVIVRRQNEEKKEHAQMIPPIRRPDGNGASAEERRSTRCRPGRHERIGRVPAAADGRGIGAQAAAALGMLTGLWVAISPWFITLQYACGNAAAVGSFYHLRGWRWPPSAPSPWQARAGSACGVRAVRCSASG